MDSCYYLGQFVQTYIVDMCSPAVTSGAFCCDVVLDPQLDSWTPSEVNEWLIIRLLTLLKDYTVY